MPVNIGVNIQRSPNRINQQLREAGVEGKFPKLLLDFKDQYYLASGGSKTLANAVTHARSGNAVMTDGYGPELVTNGGFDSDSDWTKGTGISISSGVATFSSAAFGESLTQSSLGLTVGKTYVITLQVSNYSAGYVALRWPEDLTSDSTKRIQSNGSFTFILTAASDILSFKTLSTATLSIDSVSVREMPVLKWAPHNLLTYSEDFSQSNWLKQSGSNIGFESGYSDPLNGTSAFKLTNVNDYIIQNSFTNGHKKFIWARTVSGTGTVGLLSHNSASGSTYSLTEEWQLFSRDFDTTETGGISFYAVDFRVGDLTEILVYGPHVYRSDLGGMVDNPERGDSYVPTAVRLTGPELATSTTQSGAITSSSTPWFSAEGTGQWSVSSNSVSRASGGTWESIRRAFGMQTNKAYVISFDVTGRTTGSVSIYRDFSTVFLNASENGSYTGFFVPVNLTNGDKLQFGSNNFDGTIENITIRESTVRPDTARYLPRIGHHVYNGSAWVNEGLLAESEARTNLFHYSHDFSNSYWAKAQLTATADQGIAPDGTDTAFKLTENSATNVARHVTRGGGTLANSTQYTASVYLKKGTRTKAKINVFTGGASHTAKYDIENGTIHSKTGADAATIEDVGNGWFRCSVTSTTSASGTPNVAFGMLPDDYSTTYDGDGSSFIYAWGAALEASPTRSSYIPTIGAATVTRAAETFTIPSANLPWPEPQYIGSELVSNGDFSNGTTGWEKLLTTVDLSVVSGALRLEEDGSDDSSSGRAYQSITTVVGKVYYVSVDYVGGTGSGALYINNNTNFGGAIAQKTNLSVGTNALAFVATATTTYVILGGGNTAQYNDFDNISVREINPLSVSIAMDGRVTYADEDAGGTAFFYRWQEDGNSIIRTTLDTNLGRSGRISFQQVESGTFDIVNADDDILSPDVFVPFDIASRHGSTFINGAIDGVALTEDTTPTALADLSATDLELAYDYMGTIGTFRVWDRDIADTGLVEATNPSLEPSLSLTFEGVGTNSFVVNDWAE